VIGAERLTSGHIVLQRFDRILHKRVEGGLACEKELVGTAVYLVCFGLVVGAAEKSVVPVNLATRRLVVEEYHLRNAAALVVTVKSSDSANSLAGQKVPAVDCLSNQATEDRWTRTNKIEDVVVRRSSVDCVLRLGVTGRS
jgi:hypothetical protein